MTPPYDVERVLAVLALTLGAGFAALIMALSQSVLLAVIPAVVPVLFLGLLAISDEIPESSRGRAEW